MTNFATKCGAARAAPASPLLTARLTVKSLYCTNNTLQLYTHAVLATAFLYKQSLICYIV